ncbi:hypothetical protein EVA_08382 [gut metagenome]|uniref:Uncharacterized protein n=1 Tax=gut metagenome TaxID=749906 RepID=J9GMM8_9ZZZZ
MEAILPTPSSSSLACNFSMYSLPESGGTSRPSMMAWT